MDQPFVVVAPPGRRPIEPH